MKSVVASIGMLAAVANAYNFPHHAHYRRDNGTDAQTTLTVKTTVVHTITSCAPTVTNCPARDHTAIAQLPESDKVTYVETNTVVLTEVVCPVADASSIYTSVLHDAETGGVTGKTLTAPYTASVPLTTGGPGAYPPPKGGDKTVVSDYTTDQVVTLTQGDETITSTIHKTLQTTITVPAGPQVTDNGSKGNGTPEDDTTTTTTKTKTGTVTKTIERVGVTKPASGGDNGYSTGKSEEDGSKGTGSGKGSNNGGSGSGNGECVPETVTVTAPASTVYVTVVPEASKTGSSDDATVTDKAVGGDDDSEDDDSEEFCDTTTTLEATVTVVPYPVNNTATAGYAKPTGFSRRLR
ncbi:lustrin A [Fusarium beomiforme]|uniref:Lustrin A n=1 Tax=Fusarium beomiforme TaxID=44412 RepID=A0A9P5E1D5_9HYPO|nr:lustrin A [Fusarium beomiforme]